MPPEPKLKGMIQVVLALEKIIGYKFKNARLAWEALQAQGAIVHVDEVNNAAGSQPHGTHSNFRQLRYGNKRLALIGDTALKLAIVENWFGDPDHASPGMNPTLWNFNSPRVDSGSHHYFFPL